MFKLDENPNWFPQVESQLELAISNAALVPFSFLLEKLPYSEERTGEQYETLPHRSSAVDSGEFPQQQSGNLLSSVGLMPTDDKLAFYVGFFYELSNKSVFDTTQEELGGMVDITAEEFSDILSYLEFQRSDRENGPLFMTFEGRYAERIHGKMNKSFAPDMKSPLGGGLSTQTNLF